MKQYIIDRFEGEYAVCEHDGEMVDIAKVFLPKNAKAGDVIAERDGKYMIDQKQTDERRKRVIRLQDELFK